MKTAVLALLVLQLAACASMNAQTAFKRGQKAEQSGDLAGAIREYGSAANAAPKDKRYQDALDKARRSGATQHVDAARAAEAQGDLQAAIGHWKSARAFVPSPEYEARQRLAEIRADRADPLELFEATQKLVAALPGDGDAQRMLEQSRSDAFRYFARLGDTLFEGGSFEDAFAAFEKARKVKPDDELGRSIKYRVAHARNLEAVGDRKLKAGDALGAFQAYQEAQGLAELPGLAQKVDRARKGAGSVIEQLEQARAAERLQKWEDAAELYSLIRDRQDAPPDVAAAAVRTRAESAKLRAERARGFAQAAQADKAVAQLALAVEHTDGSEVLLARLRSMVEQLQAGQLTLALEKLAAAAADAPNLPVVAVARPVAVAKAKQELEAARAIGASDPAEAMVRLRRLEALRAELPQLDASASVLKKRAFQALIERAEALGKEGRVKEATERLRTAAEIASLPPELKQSVAQGLDGLTAQDLEAATAGFSAATARDPKSKLARAGLVVAQALRLRALRAEAEAAERADDPLRAAQAYRQVLELDPSDLTTQRNLDALKPELVGRSIAAAKGAFQAGKVGTAYVYARRASELEPTNGEAAELLTTLTGRFDQRDVPLGFVAPVLRGRVLGEACPGAENKLRELAILYLSKSRSLGVDFLQAEPHRAVDSGKRERPPVELLSALESCAVNEAGGRAQLTVQLRVGGAKVAEEPLGASFDPAALPKDEQKDGVGEAKLLEGLLRESAKLMARVPEHAQGPLGEWRVRWAQARLDQKDDEGIASAYALLSLRGSRLTPREREVLAALSRHVTNQLR